MSIIGKEYPDFEKYVLSNYLCLHNGREKIRREYLDFHLDNNYLNINDMFRNNEWFDIVQIRDFDCNNYMHKNEIKELILYFLNNGYYVLHNLNESYLPHSSMFGRFNANNISMVYGYNDTNDSFMLLDYDLNGRFGPSAVLSSDYLKALSAVTCTNRINFIKAKKGLCFEFDNNRALNLLTCHINSENAYTNHEDYINNIFGYKGIERAINEMYSNGLNMIRIRVIKEHKDVVQKYMKYVAENHLCDDRKYYNEYTTICNDMNCIFFKILKKMAVLKNEQDYGNELEEIKKINDKEAILLEKYLRNYK